MLKHEIFLIETLTNTHMGSGDVSFGMVDNLIQKDPVTFLPVFHPSSLKGAIREHMEQYVPTKLSRENIQQIFGNEKDEFENEGNKPGKVKFYEARLLTLPLRATKKVYYHCTSPSVILEYLDAIETFCGDGEAENLKCVIKGLNFDGIEFSIFENETDLEVEDYIRYNKVEIESEKEKLIKKYLDVDIRNLAIFNDDIFKEICEGSIPVVARNKIGEDGTSENLFYEEVLPRRSKLWFMLGFDENETINPKFKERLTSDIIQFGANASIGYGVSKIKLVVGG